jgi:putative Ca2+/H+ antiporter (TMEM165/GDT1 family)
VGDKTQLLSFVLAARLKKPWPIIVGILVATLVNHGLAGAAGAWVSQSIPGQLLPLVTGIIFICFGLWTLHPDSLDGEPRLLASGVFMTTLLAFFLAEMGDKTQLATIALGARYETQVFWVVIGTTLGMMLANVPAVLIGHTLAERLPMKMIRYVAAALFILTGLATIFFAESSPAAAPASPAHADVSFRSA